MRKADRFLFTTILACLAGTSSAASRYDQIANHAVYMCRQIASPQASKDHGEVGFWFKSERARTSRKLWSRAGLREINTLLGKVSDPADRHCLEQLQEEATTHQLARE